MSPPRETRGLPKLTPEQVAAIYIRSWDGEFAKKLSEEFGVHILTIRSIKNKRSWQRLTDQIDAERLAE